jgi:3-hydroxybutyryl-CoA dehydrogenase
MNYKKIGVVGAGTMGSGIIQTFAEKGFEVLAFESALEVRTNAKGKIGKFIQKRVEKKQISQEESAATTKRIQWCDSIDGLATSDFVVEAIIEDLNAKFELFRYLDQLTKTEVILASNTSSISITKIAAATKKPARCVGMHFMNPVPLMPLVEVIRGHLTSAETCQKTEQLARDLGKTPIEANDYPGFISNRVLMPMINEAIFALWEGVGTKEAIDQVMKLGMNHPMGPLELADFIGLDVCLAILNVLHEGFSESKYRPCPLLKKMVDAGLLGRKSGKGFYDYAPKS